MTDRPVVREDGAATSPRRKVKRTSITWPAAAAAVVPAMGVAYAAFQRRWTTDDGFINYRIVHLLVQGHGPVFNVGERVEAYTSPLWIAVLAIGDLLLPLRLEYVGVVCGILFSTVGMFLLCRGAELLLGRPGDRWWLPAGAALLLALPPIWDWSTSGLEFPLVLFWLGATSMVLARWSAEGARATLAGAVIVGLGPLVRPDVTIYAVGALGLILWTDRDVMSVRERARFTVAALAAPAIYELFRMAYFANLLPNTALAKEANGARWREGWAYLGNLVGTYYLWLPLAALLVVGAAVAKGLSKRKRAVVLMFPIAALVHTAYIVRVGGDYQHARLLLPPLIAAVTPLAVVPLRVSADRSLRMAAVAALSLLAIWCVACAAELRMVGPLVVRHTIVTDGRAGVVHALHEANPVTAEDFGWGTASVAKPAGASGAWTGGRQLDVTLPEDVSQPIDIMYGVGLSAYAEGGRVYVLDRLGLGDPLVSRFEVDAPGFIGHEKPIPNAWLAARITTGSADPSWFDPGLFIIPLYESPPGQLDADAAAARRALSCGELAELRDATSGSLGLFDMLHNILVAPRLTFLRVPSDPSHAVRSFCGAR